MPWRERLFSWMSRSSIGLLLITLNALFSLLSCALFVYETYLPQDVAPPIWLVAAEVAMQPIFVFNYVLMLAVAGYLAWLFVPYHIDYMNMRMEPALPHAVAGTFEFTPPSEDFVLELRPAA